MVDQTDIIMMEPTMMEQVFVDEEDIEQEQAQLLSTITVDMEEEVETATNDDDMVVSSSSTSSSKRRTLLGVIVMCALVAVIGAVSSSGLMMTKADNNNDNNNIRSLQTSNTIISQQNVRIHTVLTVTNLTSGRDRRRMNSSGGSWFEYNENVGFKSREFNITWNPSTIDTELDNAYYYDDDPNAICLERSTFLPNMTEVTTVGIIFMTDQASKLLQAIKNKVVQLENSPTRNIASPIVDTSGAQHGYKKTTRISTGITTSSTWRNGEAQFLFNSTGFYSPRLTLMWSGSGGTRGSSSGMGGAAGAPTRAGASWRAATALAPTISYMGQTYTIFNYENDPETIAFEKVYIDPLDSNKRITEGIVFETRHAKQLMKYFQSRN